MTKPAAPPFVVDEKRINAICANHHPDYCGRDCELAILSVALDHARAALAAAEQERDELKAGLGSLIERFNVTVTICPFCAACLLALEPHNADCPFSSDLFQHAHAELCAIKDQLAAATERAEKADDLLASIRSKIPSVYRGLESNGIAALDDVIAKVVRDRDHYHNLYEHLAMRKECADAVDQLKAERDRLKVDCEFLNEWRAEKAAALAAAEQRERELRAVLRDIYDVINPDHYPAINQRLRDILNK